MTQAEAVQHVTAHDDRQFGVTRPELDKFHAQGLAREIVTPEHLARALGNLLGGNGIHRSI